MNLKNLLAISRWQPLEAGAAGVRRLSTVAGRKPADARDGLRRHCPDLPGGEARP